MRYVTKIKLPVAHSNFHAYTLSNHAVQQLLDILKQESNVISVEWENGDYVVTVEMLCPAILEQQYDSFELFIRDVINQNSGKN